MRRTIVVPDIPGTFKMLSLLHGSLSISLPEVTEVDWIVSERRPLWLHSYPLFVNDPLGHLGQGPSGFEGCSHMVANQVNVRFNSLGISLGVFEVGRHPRHEEEWVHPDNDEFSAGV